MVIFGSANALPGLDAGWARLAGGDSALDAVETAVRIIEDNPHDHTVGFSGLANVLGEVELDASIMDGTTRSTGAVGALHGYAHPISVARVLMSTLPHVMLVGGGADAFAQEIGAEARDLDTTESRQQWEARFQDMGVMHPNSANTIAATNALLTYAHAAGTVNVIAVDGKGNIASAVSTSGWPWKYPGRLGDTPVIGAGNYADGRYGAAACTGFGELSIRGVTAYSVVRNMHDRMDVLDACSEAILDLAPLANPVIDNLTMSIVACSRSGDVAAVSTIAGAEYAIREDGMAKAECRPRVHVPFHTGR
ncbi:MAG: isoaspartyl peptidase/L-asparaginase [Candidatus Dormibacteria bacterium]